MYNPTNKQPEATNRMSEAIIWKKADVVHEMNSQPPAQLLDTDDDLDVEEDEQDEISGEVSHQKLPNQEVKSRQVVLTLSPKKKAARKDKGNSRFTAYMLWAKHVRQEILRQNPEMDFATVSRRLGELWATVPSTEKYNWKRRAKRLAARGLQIKGVPTSNQAKNTTHRGRTVIPKVFVHLPTQAQTSTLHRPHSPFQQTKGSFHQDLQSKVPEPKVPIEPIDVAAHLALVGESLTVIGKRLTEHEGQIAVCGSLSVLLDSMLCAIG